MARLGVMMLGGVMGGIVMSLGHCVITWLGPGAGGGIRPSSHQDSASKTPSVYGVMWPSMVFCQAVWFILLVSREIQDIQLFIVLLHL